MLFLSSSPFSATYPLCRRPVSTCLSSPSLYPYRDPTVIDVCGNTNTCPWSAMATHRGRLVQYLWVHSEIAQCVGDPHRLMRNDTPVRGSIPRRSPLSKDPPVCPPRLSVFFFASTAVRASPPTPRPFCVCLPSLMQLQQMQQQQHYQQ